MAHGFQSGGVPAAPLESVVFNEDLKKRPYRPPDHEGENRAFSNLIRKLADSPETILQALVDEMLVLFKADSTGISLLTTKDGEDRFYWPAIAGAWKCFIGGGTPRHFGPCGDVVDRNCPFLFRDIERRYGYFKAAKPRVEEGLLAPFYLEGVPVGTLWIVAHDKARQFDAEDLRELESVGRFAAAAYRTVKALHDLQQKSQRLEAAEAALLHQVSALESARARLAEANADLNHFAFAAGHDLREPLRTITMYSQILSEKSAEKLSERERLCVNSIVDGCSRMDTLITDLLAYAQAAEGDRDLDDIADLNLVFDQAVSNLATAIAESEAVVTRDDLPQIRVYAEHFVQLFQNLIGNSIKYRSAQRPVIHLAVRKEDEGWHFVLSDNGLGIDAKDHQRVFEAFKRLHGREISGTGLGLAICRRIVQRRGGRIWVESALGEGTRFHFTVKCEREAAQAGRKFKASAS